MRAIVQSVIAFVCLAALAQPASGQAGITVTGAEQVRDLAPAASTPLETAAVGVAPRIVFDSPNAIRILPLPSLPAGLTTVLAEVPYYPIYLPLVKR